MLPIKENILLIKQEDISSFILYRQRNQNSAINTYPTTAFDIFTTSYKLFFDQDDMEIKIASL